MDFSFAQQIAGDLKALMHLFSGGFGAFAGGVAAAAASGFGAHYVGGKIKDTYLERAKEKPGCINEKEVGLEMLRWTATGLTTLAAGGLTGHALSPKPESPKITPAPISEIVEAPTPSPEFRLVNWQEMIQENAAQESGLKR